MLKRLLVKQGLKAIDKITDKVLKARELKKLRGCVKKIDEFLMQLKQVFKTLAKHGKTIEKNEVDIAKLKVDSHPKRKFHVCKQCKCKSKEK